MPFRFFFANYTTTAYQECRCDPLPPSDPQDRTPSPRIVFTAFKFGLIIKSCLIQLMKYILSCRVVHKFVEVVTVSFSSAIYAITFNREKLRKHKL